MPVFRKMKKRLHCRKNFAENREEIRIKGPPPGHEKISSGLVAIFSG